MRQNGNHKRPRNRGNLGRKPSNNRNQTFDSNGPSVRIRGNAFQVHEKYLTLARDAYSSGDRVMAENYFQHAEHYYRIVNATTDPSSQNRMNGHGNQQGGYGDEGDFDDEFEPQHRQMRQSPRQGGEQQPQTQQPQTQKPQAQESSRAAPEAAEKSETSDERQGERSERGERRRRSRGFNGRDGERRARNENEQQLPLDGGEQPAAAAADGDGRPAAEAQPEAAPEPTEKPRRRRRRPAASEEAPESAARDSDEADSAVA
jgi:hypothetical protein